MSRDDRPPWLLETAGEAGWRVSAPASQYFWLEWIYTCRQMPSNAAPKGYWAPQRLFGLFHGLFQPDFLALAVERGLVDAEDVGGFRETFRIFQDAAEVHFFQLVERDASADARP
jgi:hypothetical protein